MRSEDVMKIPLGHSELYVLVDIALYDDLSQHKWYVLVQGKRRYAIANMRNQHGKQTTIRMHRLIVNAKKGDVVDHINGNGLDNRLANLRIGRSCDNARNSRIRKTNKVGYKGVFKKYGHYYVNLNCKHIGIFETAEEAAQHYDREAIKLHGEFALTNKMMGLLP